MTASRTCVGAILIVATLAGSTLGTPTMLPVAGYDAFFSLVPSLSQGVLSSLKSLASAVIINPLRFLSGSLDNLPSALEQFLNVPAITFASQRITDLTIDLTQLQLFGEEMLGVEKVCKPADFRPASRQPAAIEGPTLSITFNSLNCSVDDNTSFGFQNSYLVKTIHINTTFACDKGLIEYEKTPLILSKQFHRGERYRCAECVVRKEFGEEQELVIFDGGKTQVYDSIAAFLNATDLGTVLPFADTLSLQLSSRLEQVLSNPSNAALLASVLEVQRQITAIGNALLGGYDSNVNGPLDKVLNATLAANVWAIQGIFGLLK